MLARKAVSLRAGSAALEPPLRCVDAGTEGERHRAFHRHLAVDPCDAVQDTHPAAEPADDRFDFNDVAGMYGAAVTHALDPRKKRQALPVLRLGQDQNRAHLSDRLGENRRRERRQFAVAVRQVALV